MPPPFHRPFTLLAAAASLCAHFPASAAPALPLAAGPTPMVGGPITPVRDPGRRTAKITEDVAVLRDAAADPAARAAAANRLISATDPDTQRAVAELLTTGEPAEVRTLLLREIRATSFANPGLLPPLIALAESSTTPELPQILDAAGSIRTRDAVRFLLSHTSPTATAAVRDTAFTALFRLTGRYDLGRDQDAWRAWFADVEWRPESDWTRMLAEGLASGLDRISRDRERWVTRTVETMRRAYLELSSPADRSNMLVSLLGDELTAVRRLGVELTRREIANARTVDSPVGRAVLELLRDSSLELRQSGAELVFDIRPPEAGPLVASALIAERDPLVAAAMLRLVPLWPSATVRPVVLRWVTTPGPAQRPAINAAAALFDGNIIDLEEAQDRILLALRQAEITALPAAGLRLLCTLGDAQDREQVAALLTGAAATPRLQSAEALAAYPEYLDRIIAAAAADRALFPAAFRATAAHNATLAGYLKLVALPSPNSETRRDGLLTVAARMEPRDLLAAAQATEELPIRELLLARLAAVPLIPPAGPNGLDTPEPTVIAGLILLAQTRLDLRQPAGALAALDVLTPVASSADRVRADTLRTVALLWLNRIDEAMELAAPAAAWLDGLERVLGLTHAVDVIETIELRFNGALTQAETARFQTLRARVIEPIPGGAATPAPPPPTNGPAPQPPK